MDDMIQCLGLTKKYSNGCVAVDNITLACKPGRIIGLMGPNGSGKTTLLKLIEKLLVPTSGAVEVNGLSDDVEIKKIVSYLPDVEFFGDWMTVTNALDYYGSFFEDFDRQRAMDMMNKLGIGLEDSIRLMSKGTKEKLQLILVMSRRAKLYLLDEPIGGVDPATRDFILHTIISNYDEGATIMVSTHLITDVESILDDVIFINRGQLVLQSSVDEIREQKGMSIDEYFREVFRCY